MGSFSFRKIDWAKSWPLFLVWGLCLPQALKGVDFSGYLRTVSGLVSSGFNNLPYPIEMGKNGDFFQSPITTLLLVPFSILPLTLSKIVFSALLSLSLFWLAKDLDLKNLPRPAIWTLLFLFAHALSDVFLSLNLVFASFILLWFSHRLSLKESEGNKTMAGFIFSLAIALRISPLLLVPFFFFSKKRRVVLVWTALFLGLETLTTFIFLPSGSNWWNGWLRALPLYSQAADVFTSTFQTPLSIVDRLAHFLFGVPKSRLGFFEVSLGVSYWFLSLWASYRLESQGKFDLAFSIILSVLYVSFSRVWASGLFYTLPLVVLTMKKKLSFSFMLAAVLYALFPQWLWPRPLWNYLTGTLGIQGIILSNIIYLCWKETKLKTL